jgi:hypothetical protein
LEVTGEVLFTSSSALDQFETNVASRSFDFRGNTPGNRVLTVHPGVNAGISYGNVVVDFYGNDGAASVNGFTMLRNGYIGMGTGAPLSGLDLTRSMGVQTEAVTTTATLDGSHNVVLASDASGSFTITLPAASSNSRRTYYIKKTNSSENEITIDGNGAETIDGVITKKLYVQYDAVRIVCDGSNWHIIADERIPHICVLKRNTTQALPTITATFIDFNNEILDVGGIGDIATNHRIDIKRAGKYVITALATLPVADQDYIIVRIFINNAERCFSLVHNSGAAGWTSAATTMTVSLAAGDYVELKLEHNFGSDVNTLASSVVNPTLTVTEIR